MTVTPENLLEHLRFWQGVMRLRDWDIEARFARRAEFNSRTMVAQVTIDQYRRAKILLLDPIDYDANDWATDRDPEASLLHELMHLHLYDLRVKETDSDGRSTPEWTALERACETVGRALLTLHRAAREGMDRVG